MLVAPTDAVSCASGGFIRSFLISPIAVSLALNMLISNLVSGSFSGSGYSFIRYPALAPGCSGFVFSGSTGLWSFLGTFVLGLGARSNSFSPFGDV